MKMKKVLAVVMSLCMVTGVVSYGAPALTQAITAQADSVEGSCYSFDEATGVLTLRGDIKEIDIKYFEYTDLTTSIVAEEGSVLPGYCGNLFSSYKNCISIDLSKADASRVYNIESMFYSCYSLTTVDLSGLNTKNVTSLFSLFENCTNLTTINLTGINISNVTNMMNMFRDCTSLTNLDINGLDTRNVTDMAHMFDGCSSITSLDLRGFDTSKVESMFAMFEGCSSLTTIDLSSFDISNVTHSQYTSNLNYMFYNCSNLESITLGEKFYYITNGMGLIKNDGWVNVKDPSTIVSGDEYEFSFIYNDGKNTYVRYNPNKPTYPTNIKVEYSEKYHQVRFTWDKVEGADRYGIAVYLAGKWRVQAQDITDTVYTTPKHLTPGRTYKVAIAARVNGKWDTANAIKHSVTVTIR